MRSADREARPTAEDPAWREVVPNEMGAVGAANGRLEEFLNEQGVDPQVVFTALLVVEEVVTNVIKYGFDDALAHEILLEVRLLPGELVISVTDDGHEFDPLDAPAPVLDRPIEERPIGGLGLHLVRNLTQRLSYERIGGKNVLTASVDLNPS